MPCNPSLMAMNPDDFCQDASRGLQLRELRRRLDWTQKELAEVCGVSRTSVVVHGLPLGLSKVIVAG